MDIKDTRETLDVHNADLTESRFTGTTLTKANFTDVKLQGSTFTNVNLGEARFVDVSLAGATIHDANLTGMTIDGAKFPKANITDVNLQGSTFTDVNLSESRFVDVNLAGATIQDVNLTGMTIDGILVTDLIGASERREQAASRQKTASLRPFVPALDFEVSKRFYQHLGFAIDLLFADGRGAILSLGACSFILQSFTVKEHAENYMLQLLVDDLDQWWQRIEAAKLPETFGVTPPRSPQMQPWGLVVCYVFDPSGVLWHVVQAPP